MSYSFPNFISCPEQQLYLPEAFGQINPGAASKQSGVLDFIVSDINEGGILQNQLNPGTGRNRTVELVYQPRTLESDVDTGATQACTGGKTYGETSELVTLDPTTEGANIKWNADATDLSVRCEADELYWARQMAYQMSALRRKIATDAVTQFQAQVGAFEDGTTSKTTSTKSGNAWLSDLIEDVTYQYDLMQTSATPFVFGMGDVSKYFRATDAGCCATTNIDLGEYAEQNNIVQLNDYSVKSEVGESKFLAAIPGAIQMVRYLEFEGETRVIDDGAYKQYTVIDPVNGLPYDFVAKFDCGNWFFQLKLAYKFVAMPDDMFFTGDDLSGVNYLTEWTISNS